MIYNDISDGDTMIVKILCLDWGYMTSNFNKEIGSEFHLEKLAKNIKLEKLAPKIINTKVWSMKSIRYRTNAFFIWPL